MGHLTTRDIYRDLGEKLDNLWVRSPKKQSLYEIIKRLYNPQEAEVVVKMPYTFSSLWPGFPSPPALPGARLGCGVCALSCKTEALRLKKRSQRFICPETTFERIMLQTLGSDLEDVPPCCRWNCRLDAGMVFIGTGFCGICE